jgi:hypothetical protein
MIKQKKRRFDKLRRFIFGDPWNERTRAKKVTGFIVYSVVGFILITPIFMIVFGFSSDDFKAAEPIMTPIFMVVVVGGGFLALTFGIWDWIKKKIEDK